MSATERTNFINAVIAIKASGVYDTFVKAHLDAFAYDSANATRIAHGGPAFLPWHRKFLIDFEAALQAVDASVNLPYWDWTVDGASSTTMWAANFMGGNGLSTDNWKVTTGPFAVSTGNWPLTIRSDSNTYLRRQFSAGSLPSVASVNANLAMTTFDTAPWSSASSGSFRNTLENIHNGMHNWVSATMAGTASPNDPVFFLHHCNIDRLWSMWQEAHPTATYLPSAGGTAAVPDLNEAMPPYTTTPAMMEYHALTYRYDNMPSAALPATVAFYSSQQTGNPATYAVDGSTTTMWHTQYTPTVAQPPHELRLDLGSTKTVTALSYLPRQSGGLNGTIGQFAVDLSTNGTTWTTGASGTWADNSSRKTVRIAATQARYVRLRALSEAGGRGPWASAAQVLPIGF
ncbi:tyrosinase family protein [Actinokineospora sp. HUAS TT18]|uniref:tyrosinase family protein n=1 Tax=Actinokineospora sp. HUAS TT18 TaxID=3447451 RepID=UPI003F52219A